LALALERVHIEPVADAPAADTANIVLRDFLGIFTAGVFGRYGVILGVRRWRLCNGANACEEHSQNAQDIQEDSCVAAGIESGTESHGPTPSEEGSILQRVGNFAAEKIGWKA
jgi:hypothetical protein